MTRKFMNLSIPCSVIQGIAVALFVSTVSGCDVGGCSEAGCPDPVQIKLQEPLAPGEYRLTLVRNGKSESCDQQLGETGGAGCGLGAASFTAYSIELYSRPETLTISLEHIESGETMSQEFEMDYEVSYPNGKSCGPKCTFSIQLLETSAFVVAVAEHQSSSMGGAGGMSVAP